MAVRLYKRFRAGALSASGLALAFGLASESVREEDEAEKRWLQFFAVLSVVSALWLGSRVVK